MKLLLVAMTVVSLVGCGAPGLGLYESLVSLQPYVVSVEPAEGSVVDDHSTVAIEFSQPIAPETVGPTTLAIVKDAGEGEDEAVEGLMDGDVLAALGVYEFTGNGTLALFRPGEGYEPGARYLVIATTSIQGVDGLPLNQSAGQSPTPFVSSFIVEGGEGEGSSGQQGASGDNESALNRPGFLVINELLYDALGSDTEGYVFVELLGEQGGDISGYEIAFVNGADGAVYDTIKLPDGSVIPNDGIFLIADAKTGEPGVSAVEGAEVVINFDPQNGPDCMQLIDADGTLVDALGYGTPIVPLAQNGLVCLEGTPASDVVSGKSVSRSDGQDSGQNGEDFKELGSPTPGTI